MNQETTHSHIRDYLLSLLHALDGVLQNPKYHPESDTLYHSLQVFEVAYQSGANGPLLMAALLHDVGKSQGSSNHEITGAEMLQNVCCDQVVFLVAHHLDLMRSPAKTRKRFSGSEQLTALQKLRHWDIAGRKTDAWVRTPEEALDIALSKYTPSTTSLSNPFLSTNPRKKRL